MVLCSLTRENQSMNNGIGLEDDVLRQLISSLHSWADAYYEAHSKAVYTPDQWREDAYQLIVRFGSWAAEDYLRGDKMLKERAIKLLGEVERFCNGPGPGKQVFAFMFGLPSLHNIDDARMRLLKEDFTLRKVDEGLLQDVGYLVYAAGVKVTFSPTSPLTELLDIYYKAFYPGQDAYDKFQHRREALEQIYLLKRE